MAEEELNELKLLKDELTVLAKDITYLLQQVPDYNYRKLSTEVNMREHYNSKAEVINFLEEIILEMSANFNSMVSTMKNIQLTCDRIKQKIKRLERA